MRIRSFANVIYVEFCDDIDLECNSKVHSLDRALAAMSPAWLLEAVPSYSSLALVVNPRVSTTAITSELNSVCDSVTSNPALASRLHELPVRYGGEDGPDLDFLA
ncbi:MAG: carboxyltransferase domain-containing protein, partial [Nitrososphaerota archaeon]|nr:carboxyltransferase domain-containing protein [Nitrososphaerota archaeon]